MDKSSRPDRSGVREEVQRALDRWPEPAARRALVLLCSTDDLDRLDSVGRAIARCGPSRRGAAAAFLERYEADRRLGLRSAVLYARRSIYRASPRHFVREMNRIASLPGRKPWLALMDTAYAMWAESPREMFRLLAPWLTHRDPWRRWAALHGLEVPARRDPRSVLRVLRLLRGERNVRVRRLLGHVFGQSLYPYHPAEAMEEVARWLADGASAAPSVARFTERQIRLWFDSGRGSRLQRAKLSRAARGYDDHEDPQVRSHARRLVRILGESALPDQTRRKPASSA